MVAPSGGQAGGPTRERQRGGPARSGPGGSLPAHGLLLRSWVGGLAGEDHLG